MEHGAQESTALIGSENNSGYIPIEEENNKTLLENYWYNLSMTVFQDLPQSIATIAIMVKGGLTEDPDNPTGVSLPGYLDLIPQLGNTMAGIVAAHEATRLISIFRENPASENLVNAILYSVFSTSTILNGLTNITTVLCDVHNKETDLLSTMSTFIALTATFLILCREEMKLLNKIRTNAPHNDGNYQKDIFHLICSFNLNVSITTSFLVSLGKISRNAGAYGYLFGTWFGQVPELIEPTLHKIGCVAENR